MGMSTKRVRTVNLIRGCIRNDGLLSRYEVLSLAFEKPSDCCNDEASGHNSRLSPKGVVCGPLAKYITTVKVFLWRYQLTELA